MPDYEQLLNRWQSAGVLDAEAVARIRTWESEQNPAAPVTTPLPPKSEAQVAGIAWQGRVALILGGILLCSGIILFVSAHWDQLGPGMRYILATVMVVVFHLGGALTRDKYKATSTVLHAVGTISTGVAIAVIGQIFNIQEHWPAAVLMWAIAALAGWALLRDQAQQTLSLLLVPAWLLSEWVYSAENHIGGDVYVGRFLFVWAVLYLTLFIGTERRAVRGVLFTVSAIVAVVSLFFLIESWRSWFGMEPFPSLTLRLWGWTMIAIIPILISLVRLRNPSGSIGIHRWGISTIPVLAAIAFVIALPWCARSHQSGPYSQQEPSVAAYALVAAFCVFLIWWGVTQVSRGLVNFGIVAFGATVAWFFFSNLFDQMDRSLGLIVLGVLFLAGGWALEKTRRRLLAHMAQSSVPVEER